MLIGYARVSTEEQSLELQLQALQKFGCQKIFTDKISGSKFKRTGLDKLLQELKENDTLVIWKLDRLGRSTKELIDFVKDLESKKIQFTSVTDSIDTSTPAGRFFFHVMAALAQMERELIVERCKAGLVAARANGRIGGRRKALNPDKLNAAITLLKAGTHVNEVSRTLGVSRATLYRYVTIREINE